MDRDRARPRTWAPGASVPGTPYRVIRPLGAGGMGEVYEVEHELLGARRALKVLLGRYAHRDDLAARLRTEARALAKLSHPGIVTVHDLGVAGDGRLFLAMELLHGETLRDVLAREGPLSIRRALALVVQLLDALGAAHDKGLVHRDIKPDNVFLIGDDRLKLLDFGVAKALSEDAGATHPTATGATVGTPRYMSPEQAEGRPVDARSDVYAVGLLTVEALTGEPPHAGLEPVAAAVRTVIHGPSTLDPRAFPRELVDAVSKATARRPEARWQRAEDFRRALARALDACPTDPDPPVLSMDDRFGDTEVDHAPRGAHTLVTPLEPPRKAPHDLTTPTAAPRLALRASSAKRPTRPPQRRGWLVAAGAMVVAGAVTYAALRAHRAPNASTTVGRPHGDAAISAPPSSVDAPLAQPSGSSAPTTSATARPSGSPVRSTSASTGPPAPHTSPAPPGPRAPSWLPPSGL